MGKSDLFRRTLEAGTSFLDMSRERAEAVVKEWVDAGDLGKGRAQKAIDDVLERSRKATDDLREIVRREIRTQLETMGVATRDDIARLEAKIDAAAAAAAAAARPSAGPPPGPSPSRQKAAAQKAAAQKAAAQKAAVQKAAAKRPAAAKKAVGGTVTTSPNDGGASTPGAGT